jgi:hypothetical protein
MEIDLNWKKECGHCYGSGRCNKDYEYCFRKCTGICKDCMGRGFHLTGFGRQLEEFMNQYYKPLLHEDFARRPEENDY